jgi:hypothetical protein
MDGYNPYVAHQYDGSNSRPATSKLSTTEALRVAYAIGDFNIMGSQVEKPHMRPATRVESAYRVFLYSSRKS